MGQRSSKVSWCTYNTRRRTLTVVLTHTIVTSRGCPHQATGTQDVNMSIITNLPNSCYHNFLAKAFIQISCIFRYIAPIISIFPYVNLGTQNHYYIVYKIINSAHVVGDPRSRVCAPYTLFSAM